MLVVLVVLLMLLVVLLMLLRHMLLLRRVCIAILGYSIALRGHAIRRLRVGAAVGDWRVHLRSSNRISRSLVRMAVGHWCWVASSSSEARRTSSAATESSTGTVVRRFIYANRSAVKFDVVHGSYGILGIILLCVAHEPKTTTATSVSVLDHHRFLNSAEFLEFLTKSSLLSMPRKAPYEKLRHG